MISSHTSSSFSSPVSAFFSLQERSDRNEEEKGKNILKGKTPPTISAGGDGNDLALSSSSFSFGGPPGAKCGEPPFLSSNTNHNTTVPASLSTPSCLPPWVEGILSIAAPLHAILLQHRASSSFVSSTRAVWLSPFDMFCCEYLWEQYQIHPTRFTTSAKEGEQGGEADTGSASSPSSPAKRFGAFLLEGFQRVSQFPSSFTTTSAVSNRGVGESIPHECSATALPGALVPRLLSSTERMMVAQQWIPIVRGAATTWQRYNTFSQCCQEAFTQVEVRKYHRESSLVHREGGSCVLRGTPPQGRESRVTSTRGKGKCIQWDVEGDTEPPKAAVTALSMTPASWALDMEEMKGDGWSVAHGGDGNGCSVGGILPHPTMGVSTDEYHPLLPTVARVNPTSKKSHKKKKPKLEMGSEKAVEGTSRFPTPHHPAWEDSDHPRKDVSVSHGVPPPAPTMTATSSMLNVASLSSGSSPLPRSTARLYREHQGVLTSYGIFFQEQRKRGVGAKSIRGLWLAKAEEEKVEYDKEAARRRSAAVEVQLSSQREVRRSEAVE